VRIQPQIRLRQINAAWMRDFDKRRHALDHTPPAAKHPPDLGRILLFPQFAAMMQDGLPRRSTHLSSRS
jgi:hypothetical protein